jgi:hypothetical protein
MPQFNNFYLNLNFLNSGIASLCWPLKNESQQLKHLKCKVPFLLLILLPFFANSQNLVPNPSFEEYTQCPWSSTELNAHCNDWYSWSESPDYFNACSNDIGGVAGIPSNVWGYQWPITGVAYAAIGLFANYGNNLREYMAAPLLLPLEIGVTYNVFFHASQNDGGQISTHKCAVNNIGLRFFTNPEYNYQSNPLVPDNISHLNYSSILLDSVNWTKIEGSFTADEAYNWVAIGNFYTDDNTEYMTLNEDNFCIGMYYIENVCVAIDPNDCDYLLSQNALSIKGNGISLFPNPAVSFINIQSNLHLIDEVKIYNNVGQLIYQSNYKDRKVNINIGLWSNGLYILEVKTEDGFIKPFKVLKQ